MTFGVSFNLSLEKVALPDALETLTFGKCFNQPMEKATGRSLSGFFRAGPQKEVRGKSFRDITVIHGWGCWGKDSCRKLFSPRNIQHDVVIIVIGVLCCCPAWEKISVQGPLGLNLTAWKMKPAKHSVQSELGNGIPTLFFQAKD